MSRSQSYSHAYLFIHSSPQFSKKRETARSLRTFIPTTKVIGLKFEGNEILKEWGGEFVPKSLSWEGYGYFLEQDSFDSLLLQFFSILK